MITERDLIEAIAECQGTRNPNANTCIKLAAYYTILNNIKKDEKDEKAEDPGYSYDAGKVEYSSGSEFGSLLEGRDQNEVLMVVDELMETLRIMHPKLYEAFIKKIATL